MTPEPRRLKVRFDMKHVVCWKHGEPFRKKWPNGYTIFSVEASTRLLQDEHFIKMVYNDDPEKQVNNILKHLSGKPICCRIPPEELIALYESLEVQYEVGNWRTGLCDLCGSDRIGFAFKEPAVGKRYKHICFHCFVLKPVYLR